MPHLQFSSISRIFPSASFNFYSNSLSLYSLQLHTEMGKKNRGRQRNDRKKKKTAPSNDETVSYPWIHRLKPVLTVLPDVIAGIIYFFYLNRQITRPSDINTDWIMIFRLKLDFKNKHEIKHNASDIRWNHYDIYYRDNINEFVFHVHFNFPRMNKLFFVALSENGFFSDSIMHSE